MIPELVLFGNGGGGVASLDPLIGQVVATGCVLGWGVGGDNLPAEGAFGQSDLCRLGH